MVTLAADGAVVQDADDLGRLRLRTDLDPDGVRVALRTTGTGAPIDDDTVWLDVAVLRSRAQLIATDPDWPQKWSAMIAHAERKGWLSEDGHALQVHVER